MKPQRIQMRRTKGWRKPEGAIYVGRPSKWGNPWKIDIGVLDTPEFVVAIFRAALLDAIDRPWQWQAPKLLAIRTVADHLDELRGHDLACWCPLDQPCHADVLLELANQ